MVDLNKFCLYPSFGQNNVLLLVNKMGVVAKFLGHSIEGFCQVRDAESAYPDDGTSDVAGDVVLLDGVCGFVVSLEVLKWAKNWRELAVLTGFNLNNKNSHLKRLVRSAFPLDAFRLDNGIDLDGYEVFDCEIYIPKGSCPSRRWLKSPSGKKVEVLFAVNPQTSNKKGNPFPYLFPSIIRVNPLGSVILSVEFKPNGGVHGLVAMTIAIPPK